MPLQPQAAHLFFQLVSRRYERGSLLVTANRSVGEWGEVFGDPVVATAILDRLLHHSHVITIRGESYRLREKPRAGLLGASADGAERTRGADGGESVRSLYGLPPGLAPSAPGIKTPGQNLANPGGQFFVSPGSQFLVSLDSVDRGHR